MIKIKKKTDELREIIRLLECKLGLLDESQMSCCNTTLAQCHALVEIGRAESLSLNKLAHCLGLDNSTTSRTVNNLVNSGLAVRFEDPQDRRYIKIKLTEKGMGDFQNIEKTMNLYYESVFRNIPQEKHDQVIESLHLLTEAFSKLTCCCKEQKNEK